MSVACCCPSKVFAEVCSMPKKAKTMLRVPCSSPHGQLLYIEIHPQMFVSEAKAAVMLQTSMDISVLQVNADWAEIQQGCPEAQRSFRLGTHDGNLLQDDQTFSCQMKSSQMQTLYKVVWMKQYNMNPWDLQTMQIFADNKIIEDIGCQMKGSGNTFYLRAVWGGADRPNAILGLVWQHSLTEKHCMAQRRNQDLLQSGHVVQFDLPSGLVVQG